MIAMNLSKQQALDADPKAIEKIDFRRNLERDGNKNATMFFVMEESKETVLDFSQETI